MGQGCLFRLSQGLASVLVLVLIYYGQAWIDPTMRILLPQTNESNLAPFTPNTDCVEPEASWCAVLRHYALHPQTLPVEIVFNNPNTWFNAVRLRAHKDSAHFGRLRSALIEDAGAKPELAAAPPQGELVSPYS